LDGARTAEIECILPDADIARASDQTWRTFLTNHVAALVSMDFFTVATVTAPVLFVLVLLARHVGALSTSRSRSVRPPPGPRSRSLKRSQTTPRLNGFYAASASTASSSSRKRTSGVCLRGTFSIISRHERTSRWRKTRQFLDACRRQLKARVIAFPEVGGLHHRCERRAA
jgi:hypothetical protein